eukprot:g3110.t1
MTAQPPLGALGPRGGLRDITNTVTDDAVEGAKQANPNEPGGLPLKRRSVSRVASTEPCVPAEEDPQQVAEYAPQIFDYLSRKEKTEDVRIYSGFMEGSKEVSGRMRGILLDWLIEVHYKFKLLPETLYLCVNLIDRYLQKEKEIQKRKLQLMGGTCMLIAAKYEEYRPPEVRDICYIMDNAYTREDVLDMEVSVLNTLKFSLTSASPLQFLDFFSKGLCHRESELHYLSQFCLECGITDPHMNAYLPSQLACVALYTSNRIMKPDGPEATLIPGPYDVHLMRQMEDELLKVIAVQKDKALGKKYAKERYKNVMQYVRKYE